MNKQERKIFERIKGVKSPLVGWKRKPSPKSTNRYTGWLGEMDQSFVNKNYAVLVRTIETEEYGPVMHAAIRNLPGTDIPWAEKQRIKNELFGEEREAIEFFPKASELVDEANMYHIWVFPEGVQLAFGLKEKGERQ